MSALPVDDTAVVRGQAPTLHAFTDGARNLAGSITRVAARRLRRGPRRPGWSYPLEVATELLGAEGARLAADPTRAAVLHEIRRLFHTVELQRHFAGLRARVEPGALGGVPGTWIRPRGSVERTLFYVHGGGYFFGSSQTHLAFLAELSRLARAQIFAVDYCLAPERAFPHALDEVERAYRALLAGGQDPARLYIAGDSAGGGMSLATLLRLRDAGVALPAGAMLLSPWVDLTTPLFADDDFVDWLPPALVPLAVRAYVGGADPKHPHISPLYADLTGLPPLLLLAGGAELLRPQIERFATAARAAGGEVALEVVPHMVHVWQGFAPIVPEARTGLRALARFMGRNG